MRKTALFTLLLFCLSFFISACSSGSSGICDFWGYPSTTNEQTKLKVITLSKTAFNINIGDTENIIAYVDGEDKTDEVNFILVSENTKKSTVATVEKGLIRPLKEGTAIFKVSYEGAEDVTFTVTAINPILPTIELSKTEINVELGDPTRNIENIIVMLNGEDVSDKATFTSTDENVVTVDHNGNINIVGEGTANIIVHVENANDQVIIVTVTLSEIGNIEQDISIKVRDTYNLEPTINDVYVIDKATFNSSDESVATVDENGLITATGQGSTIITISVNGAKTKEITVNVDLTDFILSKTEIDVELGDPTRTPENITVMFKDDDITDEATFTSSDENVVTVDESGNITFIDEGTANIIVHVEGANDQSIAITVNLSEIENIEDEIPLTARTTYNLIPKIKNIGVLDNSTFSSSDESVATVNENGVITAVNKGSTTITISVNGATPKEITVNVDLADIVLSQTGFTLGVIDTLNIPENITATINTDDVTDEVAFKSNDESIVTVDENGIMTAGHKAGTTTIKVSATGANSATFTVTVNDDSTPVTLNNNVLNQLYSIGISEYDSANKKSLTSLDIPAVYKYNNKKYKITAIGNATDRMFENCSFLKSVTIPDTVMSIGNSSFFSCTSLESVIIPDSVTTIGEWVFYKCTSLTSATISKNLKTTGGYTFADCTSLTSITIPDNITTIGIAAFRTTPISSINIPDSVTTIGNSAFSSCTSLTSATIGNNLTSISDYLFNGCTSLTSVNIPDNVTSIGSHSFMDCRNLPSITIPNGVTSIGEWAFGNDFLIKSITIPDSVITIGHGAFSSCHSLNSVKIGNGVKTIGSYAFWYDPALTSVTIGSSLETIGDHAFGRTPITSVTLPETVTNIGAGAFYYCSALNSINIPKNVTVINNETFYGCKFTSINIPDGVTSIGNSAFWACSYLTSVDIPENVTSIGDGAFGSCSSLTSINIPSGVTIIGNNTFNNCKFTSITIPDGVTSIGNSAFYGCSKLTSINIPNGVTNIGNSAFSNCSSLTSINFPNSVTTIGSNIFYLCSSLTSANIPENITNIPESLFYGCNKLTSINIPDDVTTIGRYAFGYCSSLTSITIPDGLTTIGYGAFMNCNKLTSINIPDSVSSIEREAFRSCSSLTSITIPNSVTTIAQETFAYCSNLTKINLGNAITEIGNKAFYDCGYNNKTVHLTLTIPNSITTIGTSAFNNVNFYYNGAPDESWGGNYLGPIPDP